MMTSQCNEERQENGVRRRMDGGGEPWSNDHRDCLGNDFHMQDIDALYGMVQFAKNASEKLFAEYVPDDYENRNEFAREFGLVALFDIKRTRGAAQSARLALSTKWYAWLARVVTFYQEVAPKFFFVIDEGESYHYLESDIWTGDIVAERTVPKTAKSWIGCWDELGLVDIRQQLKTLIRNRAAAEKPT